MTHQKENGHTPIANSLLEAFAAADLSKRELKILLVVARRTYGFNRKTTPLSATFIAEATGLDRANIAKGISGMVQRGILTCEATSGPNILGINKAFFPVLTWVKTTSSEVKTTPGDGGSKQPQPGVKTTTTLRSKQPHKKDTLKDTSKDTSKKEGARDKTRGAARQRGTRWSVDRIVPTDWRDWACVHCNMNLGEAADQAERFADYWKAVPGAKGRKLDWQATWRNWVRRSKEFGNGRKSGNGKRDPIAEYGRRAAEDDAAYEAAQGDRQAVAPDGGPVWPDALAGPRSDDPDR